MGGGGIRNISQVVTPVPYLRIYSNNDLIASIAISFAYSITNGAEVFKLHS